MSYAQWLLLYLVVTVMWLVFTELSYRKPEIFLWWILVENFVKDITTRFYSVDTRPPSTSMGTIVYMTPKKVNKERALLYYAARDFVHLDFEQKWKVGHQMGLCDHFDAMLDDERLENLIFEKVVRDRLLEDFMARVRIVKTYESS